MLLLGALLSFGWPSVKTEWGGAKPLPVGQVKLLWNRCCGSMAPMLRGGEVTYWSKPVEGESLVGQIVDIGWAAHLVTAENKRAVLTSGINNRTSDGWTPKANVRLVLRYVVRP